MKQSNKQQQAIKALDNINASNDFFFDEETGVAKFIKGRLSKPSTYKPETIASNFLEENAGLLD
ncbi:MAG: hypothetical protein KAJ63_01375, partial [Methyloprofundus sp.]|nr:hypothetical protein [Methyloprofundus sp.]